jgi:hypothetical protein
VGAKGFHYWASIPRRQKWFSYTPQDPDWQFFRSICRLLVTASVVPSSPILVTLLKEALS